MAKKQEEFIEIKAIQPKRMTVTIEGDTHLVLNKMNDPTAKALMDQRKDRSKDMTKPNQWESIITSLHWRDGKPTEFTEESFKDALKNNAPCITAFGFKKSLGEAVVRNGIDTYSTKFDASVNILNDNGLIPIKFTQHFIDEKLMAPKKGAPVLAQLNRFVGWSADIEISYLDKIYSSEQIVNIINLAGFGIGIGSGRRSCGNGRYHVIQVN